MIKKYLLSSVYRRPDDEKGAATDPEAARKTAVEEERKKITVTSVKIEDDEEKNDKEEDNKDDEQKEEDGEEETEDEGKEQEDKEDDKKLELSKDEKKIERLEKKLARSEQKRREDAKALKEANAKLEADPDKSKLLTEEDVEKRAKALAQQERIIEDFNQAVDRLADGTQKVLKIKKAKDFDAFVKEVTDDIGEIPGEIIGVLDDLDNGPEVLAHLLNNTDEFEDIYKLKSRPTKLGLELAKLSTKLSTPKPKKISQVPDPVEPLGGKSAGGERLAILASKKNLTDEEMAEYVAGRNREVAQKRANGRHNLR